MRCEQFNQVLSDALDICEDRLAYNQTISRVLNQLHKNNDTKELVNYFFEIRGVLSKCNNCQDILIKNENYNYNFNIRVYQGFISTINSYLNNNNMTDKEENAAMHELLFQFKFFKMELEVAAAEWDANKGRTRYISHSADLTFFNKNEKDEMHFSDISSINTINQQMLDVLPERDQQFFKDFIYLEVQEFRPPPKEDHGKPIISGYYCRFVQKDLDPWREKFGDVHIEWCKTYKNNNKITSFLEKIKDDILGKFDEINEQQQKDYDFDFDVDILKNYPSLEKNVLKRYKGLRSTKRGWKKELEEHHLCGFHNWYKSALDLYNSMDHKTNELISYATKELEKKIQDVEKSEIKFNKKQLKMQAKQKEKTIPDAVTELSDALQSSLTIQTVTDKAMNNQELAASTSSASSQDNSIITSASSFASENQKEFLHASTINIEFAAASSASSQDTSIEASTSSFVTEKKPLLFASKTYKPLVALIKKKDHEDFTEAKPKTHTLSEKASKYSNVLDDYAKNGESKNIESAEIIDMLKALDIECTNCNKNKLRYYLSYNNNGKNVRGEIVISSGKNVPYHTHTLLASYLARCGVIERNEHVSKASEKIAKVTEKSNKKHR